MKLLKRRGDTSTIRKVVSDDRTTLLGIVGQVQDFIAAGIIAWDLGTIEAWMPMQRQPELYERRE